MRSGCEKKKSYNFHVWNHCRQIYRIHQRLSCVLRGNRSQSRTRKKIIHLFGKQANRITPVVLVSSSTKLTTEKCLPAKRYECCNGRSGRKIETKWNGNNKKTTAKEIKRLCYGWSNYITILWRLQSFYVWIAHCVRVYVLYVCTWPTCSRAWRWRTLCM